MSKVRQNNRGSEPIEIVVAIVLGILSIGCFVLQILTYNNKTTGLENALFNLLQFLLTVGFAWFATRAISRFEFEQT